MPALGLLLSLILIGYSSGQLVSLETLVPLELSTGLYGDQLILPDEAGTLSSQSGLLSSSGGFDSVRSTLSAITGSPDITGGTDFVPLARFGGLSGLQHRGIRSCPNQFCTREWISPRCRFTPLERVGVDRRLCFACPVNICLPDVGGSADSGSRPGRWRRRRRRRFNRIRRRLCRRFNICTFGSERISSIDRAPRRRGRGNIDRRLDTKRARSRDTRTRGLLSGIENLGSALGSSLRRLLGNDVSGSERSRGVRGSQRSGRRVDRVLRQDSIQTSSGRGAPNSNDATSDLSWWLSDGTRPRNSGDGSAVGDGRQGRRGTTRRGGSNGGVRQNGRDSTRRVGSRRGNRQRRGQVQNLVDVTIGENGAIVGSGGAQLDQEVRNRQSRPDNSGNPASAGNRRERNGGGNRERIDTGIGTSRPKRGGQTMRDSAGQSGRRGRMRQGRSQATSEGGTSQVQGGRGERRGGRNRGNRQETQTDAGTTGQQTSEQGGRVNHRRQGGRRNGTSQNRTNRNGGRGGRGNRQTRQGRQGRRRNQNADVGGIS